VDDPGDRSHARALPHHATSNGLLLMTGRELNDVAGLVAQALAPFRTIVRHLHSPRRGRARRPPVGRVGRRDYPQRSRRRLRGEVSQLVVRYL